MCVIENISLFSTIKIIICVRRQTNWTFPEGVFRTDSNFAIIHFK